MNNGHKINSYNGLESNPKKLSENGKLLQNLSAKQFYTHEDTEENTMTVTINHEDYQFGKPQKVKLNESQNPKFIPGNQTRVHKVKDTSNALSKSRFPNDNTHNVQKVPISINKRNIGTPSSHK